jgi:IMP dehydrogenase
MNIGTVRKYDFDDLLLVPRSSSLSSRADVNLTTRLGRDLALKIPIIASPMKGIISKEIIIDLGKRGGIGIMHRFYRTRGDWADDMYKIYEVIGTHFGVSFSLTDYNMYIDKVVEEYNPKIICLDVANGYLKNVLSATKHIKSFLLRKGSHAELMVGNVVDLEGAHALYLNGADLIRVGIGSGQLCTTRNNTGVGYPQLSAIKNCQPSGGQWSVIADGGIRNSGDAVKAFAMGADAVMIGSLFGKCYESANNGIIYGMASRKLQEEYYHSVKSVEGIEKKLEPNISLKDFLNEFLFNIRSACTYLNAHDLYNLRDNAYWVETGKGTIK